MHCSSPIAVSSPYILVQSRFWKFPMTTPRRPHCPLAPSTRLSLISTVAVNLKRIPEWTQCNGFRKPVNWTKHDFLSKSFQICRLGPLPFFWWLPNYVGNGVVSGCSKATLISPWTWTVDIFPALEFVWRFGIGSWTECWRYVDNERWCKSILSFHGVEIRREIIRDRGHPLRNECVRRTKVLNWD